MRRRLLVALASFDYRPRPWAPQRVLTNLHDMCARGLTVYVLFYTTLDADAFVQQQKPQWDCPRMFVRAIKVDSKMGHFMTMVHRREFAELVHDFDWFLYTEVPPGPALRLEGGGVPVSVGHIPKRLVLLGSMPCHSLELWFLAGGMGGFMAPMRR